MPAHHAPQAADERLVARVRAGDQAAFEAIYDRYSRGLLAFCRHMLGSRDEAEDALQHSFVSAYRGLRGGGGEIALKPWLYAIARNRCISALRARHPEPVEIGDVEASHHAYDGLVAEVQRRAELRDLVDDLQRLPADQRAALVLFELGDHSHAEIADVLGVRREKVKALVFQAREALLRARSARDTPCGEIREELAAHSGGIPRRGLVRGHVDRCPGCADFELRVRRQRRALAAVLPVAPSVGLKATVLGSALGGAAAGGAGAGGVAAVGGTAVGGGGAAAGGAGAGGVTGGLGGAAAGWAGGAGAGAGAAGVAGGAATAGASAGAGAASVASGLATAGAGAAGVAGGVATKGVVAKILTAVVVAGAGGGTGAVAPESRPVRPPPAAVEQRVITAPAIPAAAPGTALAPQATPIAEGSGAASTPDPSITTSAPAAPLGSTTPAATAAPPAGSTAAPAAPLAPTSDPPDGATTAPASTPPTTTSTGPTPAATTTSPTTTSPTTTSPTTTTSTTTTSAGSTAPGATTTPTTTTTGSSPPPQTPPATKPKDAVVPTTTTTSTTTTTTTTAQTTPAIR